MKFINLLFSVVFCFSFLFSQENQARKKLYGLEANYELSFLNRGFKPSTGVSAGFSFGIMDAKMFSFDILLGFRYASNFGYDQGVSGAYYITTNSPSSGLRYLHYYGGYSGFRLNFGKTHQFQLALNAGLGGLKSKDGFREVVADVTPKMGYRYLSKRHFYFMIGTQVLLSRSVFSLPSVGAYFGFGAYLYKRKQLTEKQMERRKPSKRLLKHPKLGYLVLGGQLGVFDFAGSLVSLGIHLDHLWTLNEAVDIGYFVGVNGGSGWDGAVLTLRGGLIALFGKKHIRFETTVGVYSEFLNFYYERGYLWSHLHVGFGLRLNPGNGLVNIRIGSSTTAWGYVGIAFQLGTKKRNE